VTLFKVTTINPSNLESHEIYVAAVNPGQAENKAVDYARTRYHMDSEAKLVEVVANEGSSIFPAFLS
jgi:hypothetical protein